MNKEKIFNEFDYLSKKYASKVFAYENLGFEYEDLIQEFRIKIWTSLQAYEKRLDAYEKGLAPKPVPVKFYLECACANKVRDFIKYINQEPYVSSIDDIEFDYGISEETDINPSTNRFIINGVDLLEGLCGRERVVFSLFLRGCKKNIYSKVYKGDVVKVINKQRKRLISTYGDDLAKSRKTFM